MNNAHGKSASDVRLGTLPPSYGAIFRTQSDEHYAASTVPPYPISTPMSMPMPMSTALHVSEPISEVAQEDGKPMLEPVNIHSVDLNVSNEEIVADNTEERSSSQCMQCIGVIVILIVIVIIICTMANEQSGASSANSYHSHPHYHGGRYSGHRSTSHGHGSHGSGHGGSHGHGGGHHG